MYTGMADKLYFQIFYGQGEICYGPEGVDLSGFKSVTKGIARASERTFGGVYNWLLRFFNLDSEQYELTVMAVVSRASVGVYWELLPLEGTTNWRRYVEIAMQRGLPLVLLVQAYCKERGGTELQGQFEAMQDTIVQDDDRIEDPIPQQDEGHNSTAPIEPTGEADEGERIPEIVEQMEQEDREHINALDEDNSSDDEDGDHVPAQWKSYDYSNLTVSEGAPVSWEFSENEICVGATYPTGDAVKDAVKQWSTLSLRRQFRVHKSSPNLYDVKCVRDSCPFRVHAFKGKWSDFWEVSRVTEHTCELEELEAHHRNLSATFIANHIYAQIVENPSYEPKSIIRAIEETFKYTISYSKAYRAKRKVMEMRFGTYEASYDNLPRLLSAICHRNTGSYYDLKQYPSVDNPGKQVLQRAYFSLGACIEAFKHCRPVICIDGTFLTGKYSGQILTAIGVDGNNQVLPLAFAFVESENGDSWYWFLERLKNMVVKDRPDVCVIHDRHAGILQAMIDIQHGSVQRRRTAQWTDLKSR